MGSQISKIFHACMDLIHLRKNKQKTSADAADDEAEDASEDESTDEAANVSMNEGVHGKVFSVRRKLVMGFVIGGALLFVFAISFSLSKETATKSTQPMLPKEEAGNMRPDADDGLGTASYEDLAKLNASKRNGNTKNPNGKVVQAQKIDPAGTTGGNSGSIPQTMAPRTLPAIPSYGNGSSYSQPYALPSMAGAQTPTAAVAGSSYAEEQKEQKEKDSIEDRFKSAISFALGKAAGAFSGNGNAGATSAAASNSTENVQDAVTPVADSSRNTAGYSAPTSAMVQAGTILPAMLWNGINTDSPGQVIAQVQADVYDSATQSNLLIPAGSQLLGTYDAGKAASTGRVAVSFSTIIMPDGGSYAIGDGSMIAMDGAGYSGIEGQVHRHTGRVLGGGMMSSALAALGSLASGNTSANNTYTGGQLAMQGAIANLMNSASQMFNKGTSVAATVTIEPGHEFNVYVMRSISFGN